VLESLFRVLLSVLEPNGRDAVKFFTRAKMRKAQNGSDVVMPGMDGQMALKLMRIVEKTLPAARDIRSVIIMTTALNSPDKVQGSLWQGDFKN